MISLLLISNHPQSWPSGPVRWIQQTLHCKGCGRRTWWHTLASTQYCESIWCCIEKHYGSSCQCSTSYGQRSFLLIRTVQQHDWASIYDATSGKATGLIYAYLWMAPILAQASMDAHIRGDTVMYIVTRSPFCTPCFLRRFAIWHVLSSSCLEGHMTSNKPDTHNIPLSMVHQFSNITMSLNIYSLCILRISSSS